MKHPLNNCILSLSSSSPSSWTECLEQLQKHWLTSVLDWSTFLWRDHFHYLLFISLILTFGIVLVKPSFLYYNSLNKCFRMSIPLVLKFPLRTPLLPAAVLVAHTLAPIKQKVCSTLIFQSQLCKLNQLKCLWYWLLFLLIIISPPQLGHKQD